MRRIPGISLETDEGEGRYVNCRGLDADLNSTTFGGLRLPPTNNASPFGGYRAATLDSIPIGLVGALTVTKLNLPSQDAEALGCTLEITPKTAPQNGAPFIQGNVGSGYEPLRGTPIIDVSVSAGGRFGGSGKPSDSDVTAYSDRPFSVVLTATYYDDQRGFDDVEPGYFDDTAKGAVPAAGNHPYDAISNIDFRDYELHRKRHGYGVDLGYQPDAEPRSVQWIAIKIPEDRLVQALMREQPALALQPAAVACQRAVGADHPVTRHQNGDGIAPVGEAYGARSVGIADSTRKLAVAPCLPIGDFPQLLPHAPLKRSAFELQWQIELAAAAGEIFAQLQHRRRERRNGWIFDPSLGRLRRLAARLHEQTRERVSVGSEQETADRTFHVTKAVHGLAPNDCHR